MDISRILIDHWEADEWPCGVKDLQSRFVFVNRAYKMMQCLPESFNIEGRLDGELPCPTYEFEKEFQAHDQLVAKTLKTKSSIEIHPFWKEKKLEAWIFHKRPFYVGNECVGVYFWAEPAKNIDSLVIQKEKESSSIALSPPSDIFTEMEWEVLYLLMQFHSTKEISLRMGVTVLSVRKTIERMMYKSCTNTRKSLIDYCIAYNISTYIPSKYIIRHQLVG